MLVAQTEYQVSWKRIRLLILPLCEKALFHTSEQVLFLPDAAKLQYPLTFFIPSTSQTYHKSQRSYHNQCSDIMLLG